MRARHFESVRGSPPAPGIMRIRATYVGPDTLLTLIQLKDLVLWRRTTSDHPMHEWRIQHVTFSGVYPSAAATFFACANPWALFFGGSLTVEGRVVCM